MENSSNNVSILIIDDEENLRRTLALILKREGYQVTTAGSIHEARDILHKSTYDLAFLDLKLPDANGLSLLPDMRKKHPKMPVLILTAHDKLESATEAVRQGARDYLLKPIDPALIVQRVKEMLAEEEQPKSGEKRYSQLQKLIKDKKMDKRIEDPSSK